MSTITLSDGHAFLKIHTIAQALMRHHYAQLQSLVQDLGPLLHERPSKVGDCYSMLDSSLRDNISTHQALDLALENYESLILLQKNNENAGTLLGDGMLPEQMPLTDYQALVQTQLKAYKLLKLQHFSIKYALSMMCFNYGLEEDSKASFCVQQLKKAFEAPEHFIQKMVWTLEMLEAVLVKILNSNQDRPITGMELVVALSAQCQCSSLETVPFIPTPYGGTALRLQRLKEAQAAHRSKKGREDLDNSLEEDPVF